MFAKTSPEVSSNLTNVKKWASTEGYPIDKILGLISEMVTDGKGRFRTSYLSYRTYVTAGVASISVSFELGHYILYIPRALFHVRVCDDHFCAYDYDFFLTLQKGHKSETFVFQKKKKKASITLSAIEVQVSRIPDAFSV